MKLIKGLAALMLAGTIVFAGLDADAQARKTTAKKSTTRTATTKKPVAKNAPTGTPVSLGDVKYQGVAKIAGEALDLWAEMTMTDNNVNLTIAEAIKYVGTFTATENAGAINVKGSLDFGKVSGVPVTLKSTDKASSFEGKTSLKEKTLTLWLLKIPNELKPATQSESELTEIIGNSDGYTSFLKVFMNGMIASVTAEASFDSATSTWELTCDSPTVQKIMANFRGKYKVSGNNLILYNPDGKEIVKTPIYDDGKYISAHLGSYDRVQLELVLIR